MKKQKILLIINIIQAVILVFAIVATIFILPKIWLFEDKDSELDKITGTDDDIYNSYADITDYGAIADDGKDDSTAINKALKTGASIYIPKGTFNIDETIELEGQNIIGAGNTLSVICAEEINCIINTRGNVLIRDIAIEYDQNSLSGKEKAGEKIAIKVGGDSQNSLFLGLKIENIGTAFYSPLDSYTKLGTVQSTMINNFSFTAIDIKNALQTVIRASVISNEKFQTESALKLGGMFTIESLNINNLKSENPVIFENATAATVKAIQFSQVFATQGSFIKSKSSNINIWSITVKESTANSIFACIDGETSSTGTVTYLYSDSEISFDVSEKILLLS